MSYSHLFKNRWMALFWAACVCWTAYEMSSIGIEAPAERNSAATDANAASANATDAAGASTITVDPATERNLVAYN
jgi:hypothetical protein